MLSQDHSVNTLKGKRVIIVEDEGITVMQLRSILTHAGMNVIGAVSNANDAIDIILDELPDLVLMDINMPGDINGMDAMEAVLRAVRICVVMVTAYSDEKYKDRAKEMGACGYVVKPISKATLLPYLQEVYFQGPH